MVEDFDDGPFLVIEGGAKSLGVGAGEFDEPGFVFFHLGEGFGGGHDFQLIKCESTHVR